MNKELIKIVFLPLFIILILFPVLALVFNLTAEGISATMADPFFWNCVKNTLIAAFLASVLAMAVAVGFAYYHLFHRDSIVYKVASLFNDLPIALPHTVAGLALLLAFGRKTCGFLGETGAAFTLFAVILAMFFVSYSLAARTLVSGVDQMEPEVIDVARTLGDNPSRVYFRVVLPLMGEALFSGFVLGFSRSLSEFAAVIMFGGNMPGRTQVLASYVFTKVEVGDLDMAVTAAVFCVVLSLSIVSILSIRGRRYAAS
ncbi:ABC-type sulfate transport system, permease component NifC (plasmid) [Peptoclostridium acidaminophilum DSM 3953]|uniref:ABC-type sulfate transport system, permease component NifC n=1 Tax=Peptoclostridium acidaminophilum DSM 3953 TaxID=1286171 RepID=W8UAC8_PEPAC|nr:ABC transporter permease [Peptoclostridium acidaminophilum]AHM57751.1 ABC-type sulfate transport system, permease component NifC [Peptoclostridium acidaminophilum DSM 3953]